MIKNIQLKTLFLVNTLIIITSLSCANLDPDITEFNSPPGSYGNLTELDRGITGIYNQIVNASRWTTFFAPAWAGDDITTHAGLNKADFRQFDQRNVESSNGRLLSNWNAIISVINATNSVLEQSKKLAETGANEKLLNQYLGETYFIRGVMFYQLARVHGKIPLPLTQIPDPNIRLSSNLDVFKQIEKDLLEAETKLPDVYPGVNRGAPRPNNGSARAFLARLYLDWAGFPIKDNSKYGMAASSAKKVIDNAAKHNFGLVDNLESLWTVAGRYNDESVFTLSYCNTCGNQAIANWKFGILGLPTDLEGWNETYAEIKFFQDMPAGARKSATYRLDLDWENFTDQASPIFKKIAGPPGDLPGSFITSRNDYLMRYAEVLLIYAEASARSGNSNAEAWEALNKIRRRAAGQPYATRTTIDVSSGNLADLTVEERKWEFAGEYLRWYDLIRLELVQQALSNRNPTGSIREYNPIIGSLGTDNYFSPIPDDAVSKNPNLRE